MERIAAEINIPVNTAHSSGFLPTPLRLLNNNESVINLHRSSPPVGDLWSQEQPKGTRRGSKDNLLKMFMEKHQPRLHIPRLKDEDLKRHFQLCETFQITKDWENACNMQRMEESKTMSRMSSCVFNTVEEMGSLKTGVRSEIAIRFMWKQRWAKRRECKKENYIT